MFSKLHRLHPDVGEEELADIAAANRHLLSSVANSLFDRITSQQSIDTVPREIRAIAHFIGDCADEWLDESSEQNSRSRLLGGFIFLRCAACCVVVCVYANFYPRRFFNPAIVTPEAFHLVPNDTVLSTQARRNLLLVTKLLQNLSNGVLFGTKVFTVRSKDVRNF